MVPLADVDAAQTKAQELRPALQKESRRVGIAFAKLTNLRVATYKLLGDRAVALAGARALVAAGRLRVKTRPADGLTLSAADRATLAQLPTAPASVKKKLAKAGLPSPWRTWPAS